MRKINKIRIFANENEESYKIKLKLQGVLEKYKFEVVEEDYDLAIAIGGDGSFLRMVNGTNFNSDIYYVGINTGTLGFLIKYFIGKNILLLFILDCKKSTCMSG